MSNTPDNTATPPVDVPRLVSLPRVVWMVYEDNQKWAIPKRPKFVIEGSQEDVDRLIQEIERSRRGLSKDTRLVAHPIRMFSDVAQYRDCERAAIEKQMEEEIWHRGRVSFLG